MIRIRFIKPYGHQEGQGAGPHYEEGKEYSFSGVVEEGYARAYIDRGAAVEVKDEPKPIEPKPTLSVPKPVVTAPIKAADSK